MKTDLFGIDELRRAVRVLANCNESFNQRFTAAELLKLVDLNSRSGWDFYPDQLDERQVREALDEGWRPQWKEDLDRRGPSAYVPVYADGTSPGDDEREAKRRANFRPIDPDGKQWIAGDRPWEEVSRGHCLHEPAIGPLCRPGYIGGCKCPCPECRAAVAAEGGAP